MTQPLVPYYRDTLADHALVAQLSEMRLRESVPHALLLAGRDGGEVLPLAMAFARHLLCEEPGEDSCGRCTSCRQMDLLEHPDFYLCYPVVKTDSHEVISGDLLGDFTRLLAEEKRFTADDWRVRLRGGNRQPAIFVAEADHLIHITSLSSFRSPHQVILIWQPEAMREDTANKLLKLLEEPPKGVVFIGVSHDPERLLPTIASRFQRIDVPPVEEERLVDYLVREEGVAPEAAAEAGHLAQGNLLRARRLLAGEAQDRNTDLAIGLMETAMARDPRAYRTFADKMARQSRPEVLALVESLDTVLRETVAISYGDETIIYTRQAIRDRLRRIASALPLEIYPTLMDEVAAAYRELRQNASVKIVFFDLLVTIAMLIPAGRRR